MSPIARSQRMTRSLAIVGVLALTAACAAGVGLALAVRRGFRASDEPSRVEAFLARRMRSWAVPVQYRNRRNPLPADSSTRKRGMAHWADHCASCHANDGSGKTVIGLHLYPRAPDMRAATTQRQTDGELFHIIQNGLRLTGMPAWGGGDDDEETWSLVTFIRYLPALSADEVRDMERLNPQSRAESAEADEEEEFLRGGAPADGGSRHPHPVPRSVK